MVIPYRKTSADDPVRIMTSALGPVEKDQFWWLMEYSD